MTGQRDIHSIFTSFALFSILCNAILALTETPLLHLTFSLLRFIGVAYAFVLVLLNFKAGRFTGLIAILYAILGALTYIHHGALNVWASHFINSLGLSILLYFSILRSPANTLRTISTIFAILIYFNFFSIFIYPDGIFNGSYPLGQNYNQIGSTLLCGIAIASAAYNMHVRSFSSTLILCLVCIITPAIFGSMTSLVGCSLATIFFFIYQTKIRRIVILSFFVFYLFFQASVVFLQADMSGNRRVVYLVENVMGKELTFSYRTVVWLQSYELIQSSPTTGYGFRDSEWFLEHVGVRSAHNIILQLLIYGGKVLLLSFIGLIAISVFHSLKNRSDITDSLLFGLCTLFFMMMMENYNLVLIILLINILYYAPDFSKEI